MCVGTDEAHVLVIRHAPQQLSVSVTHVRPNQSNQLVPRGLAHNRFLAFLPVLLQDGERSNHLVSFRPDQLPYFLLSHKWSADWTNVNTKMNTHDLKVKTSPQPCSDWSVLDVKIDE